MKSLMIFCSFFCVASISAQNLAINVNLGTYPTFADKPAADEQRENISLFVMADRYPEFPGGEQEMSQYISENVEYPELAYDHGHEGTVIVEFIIEEDGRISHPKVLKGIGLGCDEAALAVVEDMPRWTPAYQGGRTIPVKYVTPVTFRIF